MKALAFPSDSHGHQMTSIQSAATALAPEASDTSSPRRGDLDALRSFAMLLGVFLHASLAYFDYPWPVQDAKRSSLLQLSFAAIHGFRMPLFFLLSGFFSMLLLRRRGLRALLTQRALRIVLPFMLAAATILPLDNAVIYLAVAHGSKARAARSPLTAVSLPLQQSFGTSAGQDREPASGGPLISKIHP
jgi:peptidoglycan/LPS O-acetylase OafA/YrhL